MNSSILGTLFRIVGIFSVVLIFWLLLVAVCYIFLSTVLGVELKVSYFLSMFLIFLVFRMFYPKNVFK